MNTQNLTIKYQRELVRVLFDMEHQSQLQDFFSDLLTPKELREIPVRWQIIKELAKGTPQREISKKFKVSIATVTRGARALEDDTGGFQKALKHLKKNI